MIRTQSIIIFGYQGEPFHQWFVHRQHSYNGVSLVAYSQVLVCPKCRELWAILQFLDEDLTWPVSAFCEQCQINDEWHPVPGSILVEEGWGVIDDALLAALPPPILEREFRLHMEAYTGDSKP